MHILFAPPTSAKAKGKGKATEPVWALVSIHSPQGTVPKPLGRKTANSRSAGVGAPSNYNNLATK